MSEIDRYLDDMFDRLAGTGAAGRRALAEAEDHLRTAAEHAMACGTSEGQAERDAVRRFGRPATIARRLRSACRRGRFNRALSGAWLLIGLTLAGMSEPLLFFSDGLVVGPFFLDGWLALAAVMVAAAVLAGWGLAWRYLGLAYAPRSLPLIAAVLYGVVGPAALFPSWFPAWLSGQTVVTSIYGSFMRNFGVEGALAALVCAAWLPIPARLKRSRARRARRAGTPEVTAASR
jgi:hypothetical protein